MKPIFNKKIKRHFELLLKTQKKEWPVNFIIHISHRRKNVFLTFTDFEGRVFFNQSFGLSGFEGATKSTPLANKITLANFLRQLVEMSVFLQDINHPRKIAVYANGFPRPGTRKDLIKILEELYTTVSINENSPIPHNGCKVQKKRRI